MFSLFNKLWRNLCGAALFAALAACGGGGGSSPIVGNPPPPVSPPPPPPIALEPGQAQTSAGVYQGSFEDGLIVFRGIRFAAPPVGDLRFRPPAAPAAFEGVRDAAAFGSECVQIAGAGTIGNEDCLYLNVWSHDDDVVRPVFVYLHPGGMNGVGGHMSAIEGANFAKNGNVVVVNFNRRFGPLGFLAIDELVQESATNTAGNYAVLDAIAALEWVRDNIQEFNGDPSRIMLSGTSAGGGAACAVVSSPRAAGLIHSLSLQSPACGGSPLVLDDQVGMESEFDPAVVGHRGFLDIVGCSGAADVLDCLRGKSAHEIIEAGETYAITEDYEMWRPVVDLDVIASGPYDALANQVAGDFPVIVGSASNELDRLLANIVIADDQEYRDLLAAIFGDPLDDQIYALYPSSAFPTPWDAFATLINETVFVCPAEEIARSAASGAPSYLFQISRGPEEGTRGYHGVDLPYLFGNFDAFGLSPDATALDISDAMQRGWSSLALDPTAPPTYLPDGASAWPVFDAQDLDYVDFGDTIETRIEHRGERCGVLRSLITI